MKQKLLEMVQVMGRIFADRLATCKIKYSASALRPKKFNSSNVEKYETKIVGNGSSNGKTHTKKCSF